MFAITGITGKVGGVLAEFLLAKKLPVRAVLRDSSKASSWRERGCEIAIADMNDVAALTAAFDATDAVFVLLPPIFDPSPGFPEARATVAAVRSAIEAARPDRVVCLSTIGALATQPNLLTQLSLMEKAFTELPMPVAFLRPAWFMENCSWDVAPARDAGVIPSFLQPLDKPFPMVATRDIGQVAAELIQESWTGVRVIELEGPSRITPNEIASTFAAILGREVRAQTVARQTWEELFKLQGMSNPKPRIQMLNGFCDGWINFENDDTGVRKGRVQLVDVLKELVAQSSGN